MKVIACIPAHNEEKSIAKVLLKTRRHVNYIITCNDGSTDYTGEIAERLSNQTLNHKTKLGYGKSLIDLFKEALKLNPSIVVTLDADDQHNPDDIPKLVQPILDHKADVVLGSRFLSHKVEAKKYRRFGIKTINFFMKKVSDKDINDTQCGFRAYSKQALKKLHLIEDGMGISTEILLKTSELGLKVIEIPIQVYYKGLDTSSQNPISHASNVVGAIIRSVVERHPFKYFGISALILLSISIVFTARTLELYIDTGMLITNLAIVSMFSFMVFVFFMNMAVTLYALSRIRKEIELR